MARSTKRSEKEVLPDRLPGSEEASLVAADVASYLSHIRALIVAGNVKLASKSLDNFRLRFGEKWFDVSEIREIDMQIKRMKGITGK